MSNTLGERLNDILQDAIKAVCDEADDKENEWLEKESILMNKIMELQAELDHLEGIDK